MIHKNIAWLAGLGLCIGLFGCKPANSPTPQPAAKADSTRTDTTKTTAGASAQTVPPAEAAEKTEICVYKSATVYASSTDFEFQRPDGSELRFRFAEPDGDPETAKYNPLMPKGLDMLGPASEEGGPPDANPKLVGKSFEIVTKGDQVLEVRLKK